MIVDLAYLYRESIMRKEKVYKKVCKKIKVSDNMYRVEIERELVGECQHYYDETKTLRNSLGFWRTCEKCHSTKLSYK